MNANLDVDDVYCRLRLHVDQRDRCGQVDPLQEHILALQRINAQIQPSREDRFRRDETARERNTGHSRRRSETTQLQELQLDDEHMQSDMHQNERHRIECERLQYDTAKRVANRMPKTHQVHPIQQVQKGQTAQELPGVLDLNQCAENLSESRRVQDQFNK